MQGALSITLGATVAALVAGGATPAYAQAQAPVPPPGVSVDVGVNQGGLQVQGQLQYTPPGTQPAPVYQGYPQGYPPPYPPPPPGAYPPGYYPQGPYPPPVMQPYAPPVPPPRVPVRYESRPMYKLILAGSIMLGSAYLMTAGITGYVNMLDCNSSPSCGSRVYWPLYVPLVGPFIYMGVGDKDAATLGSPAFVISGLAQLGGLALIIAGAVVHHKVPIYADEQRISLAPYFTPTNAGLMAMGHF